MNDCKGIYGKLFGHKFESYLIKKKMEPPGHFNLKCDGQDAIDWANTCRDECEIVCQRCGARPDVKIY